MNTGSYDVVGGKGGPGRFEIRGSPTLVGPGAGGLLAQEKLVRNGFKFPGAFFSPVSNPEYIRGLC
jgi:hypothetical protein